MNLQVELGDLGTFPVVHRINRRMRRVILRVQRDQVLISSPGVSQKHLKSVLAEHHNWLKVQAAQFRERPAVPEEVYYLGEKLALEFSPVFGRPPELVLDKHKLRLRAPELSAAFFDAALERFLLARGREFIYERLIYWSARLQLAPQQVRFKRLKSRWGSCSAKGNINFNYRMIQLPGAAVDAIVVHELVHLKHLNHGPHFWRMVYEHIPDYQRIDQVIRELSPEILKSMPE